ncbi:MAG: glycosyltransferase, partial [Sphaerobacter sp.]|nr:glycosyltransferase [Sphaerobacter sp.]
MLGTFGFRPKATLRARALGIAQALVARGWSATIGTTPWDSPADAGSQWSEGGVRLVTTRTTHALLWPLAVREMLGWARRDPPALVHVFKPKGFGDLAGRRLRRRLPVVIDMDDWEGDGGWNDTGLYGPLQRRLFDWQERTWPPRAAALTVASRTLAERACELGAPSERVFYVPNGLSAARFHELAPDAADRDRASSLPGTGPRILLYTRFVEFDPATLVRMLLRVRATEPSAVLVIAGASADGRPEAALDRAAAAAGVGAAIVRLGWVAAAEVGS